MFNRAWRIVCLLGCAAALGLVFAKAGLAQDAAPDVEAPPDARGFTEIRNLSKLPPDLARTLGWHQDDRDHIADFEREPGAIVPRWVDRWFLLAGVSGSQALVAIEEQRAYPSSTRVHAKSYALAGTQWVAGREWILASHPHTLGDLTQVIQAPESQALTVQWQERLQADDLLRRRAARSIRSPGPLRAVNINDEEVRQIEAVVRDVYPGAIVNISAVTQGCPCEEGPACSAQVSTAIFRQDAMRGLALSDINEHWIIGPVQQWYLDEAKLKRTTFPTFHAYAAALQALEQRFPTCAIGPSSGH